MQNEKTLKPIAKRLKKEWLAMGLKDIKASRLHHGICLRSSFQDYQNQRVGFTALVTLGINPEKTANLVIDVSVPLTPLQDTILPAFCAFLQQASGLLSPLALLMDVQGQQLVMRQSQILALKYPVQTQPIHDASLLLMPLLQTSIDQIMKTSPKPNEAREMANHVATSYYGAMQNAASQSGH